MILVSSFEINKNEVVPLYYMRQTVEKLIGFAKDDLDLIPLRVHREETLRDTCSHFYHVDSVRSNEKRDRQRLYCRGSFVDYEKFEMQSV